MTNAAPSKQLGLVILAAVFVIAGSMSIPEVRNLALKSLQSLRMQKVQAVNANFSQFADANRGNDPCTCPGSAGCPFKPFLRITCTSICKIQIQSTIN